MAVTNAAPQRPRALTAAEAAARLVRDGANELPRSRPVRWSSAVAHQLTDVVVLVLLAAGLLTASVGDVTDTAVIAAVVALNTVLGAGQEIRSGRALEALADLTAPQARVVRDGRTCDVPAREVVVGDRLLLAAGDVIAADALVTEAESLQVDESMLSGESVPVDRPPGDRVAAGTVVVRGHATTLVTATGANTSLGAIARSIRPIPALTPLQRQLAVLGRALAIAVAIAAVVVAALNLLAGHGLEASLVLAISLAVAAIPESLPAVVALSLAMAARRMAARGVLVRRLAAVEALGSVTVLGMDKTGTLTTGRMTVAQVWTPTAPGAQRALWEAAVLCNDADVVDRPDDATPGPRSHRDPVESALLTAADAAGVDVAQLRRRWPRIDAEPFEAATARMTTTHRGPDGQLCRFRKGAPERVFSRTDPLSDEAIATTHRFAAAAMRTLGVVRDDGEGWYVLGVIAMSDPPRPEAAPMIAAFRGAGVRPVMITGDHAGTARAVAHAVGLDDGSDAAVHARVGPDGKTAIVERLRASGEIVAMTGDGVNDAPALRAADIGVAMGRRGTEVAKQAADLILTSDDLSPMVPAIAEGRRAYDNLRRFLHYALAGGTAEVLVMLLGPGIGFSVPLQAGQILWVNLLTHGLPGVAMGDEGAEPDVLSRPPRPSAQRLVDRNLAQRLGVLGAAIAAASMAAGVLVSASQGAWQTSVFVTLTLAQLGVALALRPRGAAPNRLLLAAIAVNVALTGLAVWWAPLAAVLHTEPLSLRELALCLAAAAVPAVVARWQLSANR